MKLVVEDLRKDYHRGSRRRGDGDKPALDGVSLAIEDGAFFTLLGPSGCGKTTLLRCIAGLEVPDSGEIRLGDRVLFSSASGTNIPPNRRELGMVFQSYAIWPHMDVSENVAYPLTVRGRRRAYSRAEIERRVADLLDVIQIAHLAKRKATMRIPTKAATDSDPKRPLWPGVEFGVVIVAVGCSLDVIFVRRGQRRWR